MKVIDAKGLKCPEPLMLLHKAIYEAESGEEVLLISKFQVIKNSNQLNKILQSWTK